MRSRRRRYRNRLVMGTLQLSICLLLLEAGLRLAEPFSDTLHFLLYQPHAIDDYSDVDSVAELLELSILGFRPLSERGGFILNSRGLRSPEWTVQRPPGTLRVVTLGDSFTFSCAGIPWDVFWPTLVARGLEQQVGRPVELANLGVPGVGPAFYHRMWQLEGAPLTPDVVVVAFFVGNDFARPEDDTPWSLSDVSAVYRLLHHALLAHRGEFKPPPAPAAPTRTHARGGYEVEGYAETYIRNIPPISNKALLDVEIKRAWSCIRGREARFEESVRDAIGILGPLFDEIAATGARGLLVIIPDRFQIHAADQEAILAARRANVAYDWDLPQRRLTALAEQRGIPFLDLLGAFRDAAEGPELYAGTHWTVEGCELAAREILKWLAAQRRSTPGDGPR